MSYNLLDVDSLVEEFIEKHKMGIATVHRYHFRDSDELSLRSFTKELVEELKTGCVAFLNKESPVEELDSYLFYIVNAFGKKQCRPIVSKKKTEYLCPACLFMGKENLVYLVNKLFKCDECESELKSLSDPKKVAFFRAFFKHNKLGYRCQDCDRFIPHPLDDSPVVSCPYFDCCFVGTWTSLKRMHHPTSESNAEILTLDDTLGDKQAYKDMIVDVSSNQQNQLLMKEDLEQKISVLTDVIDSQKNSVPYNSSDFTIKHKYFSYEAFYNLLKKYPEDMVSYLLDGSRSGGFQHKVFQEYIRLLENAMPFSYKKNGKQIQIESLLDDNLKLFEGISYFEAFVTDKQEVKNNTKEFYIGGRKGAIAKPYYIGKLLSVNELLTKTPLTDKVIEYSFSKIKLKDIKPGTEVIVTHLRVPPHYQMGGMVYVNRVRKKIVDRALLTLKDFNA